MHYAQLMILSPRGWEAFPTPGPSPTLGSLEPSHHRRHNSQVSLWGPPCGHGVTGICYGKVHNIHNYEWNKQRNFNVKNTNFILHNNIGNINIMRNYNTCIGNNNFKWSHYNILIIYYFSILARITSPNLYIPLWRGICSSQMGDQPSYTSKANSTLHWQPKGYMWTSIHENPSLS